MASRCQNLVMSYPYRTAHSKVVAWVDVMPKGAHAQRIINARHCRLTLLFLGLIHPVLSRTRNSI